MRAGPDPAPGMARRIARISLAVRRWTLRRVLAVIAAGLGSALLVAAADPEPPPPVIRIHFLDIGQGAATLVELPCGAALLDTGGEHNDSFQSTPALMAYLEAFFARRADLGRTLDLLLLTHPHIDHVRGAPAVLERYAIRTLVEDGRAARQDDALLAMGKVREYVGAHPEVKHLVVNVDEFPDSTAAFESPDLDRFGTCKGVDPRVVALWGGMRRERSWGENDYGNTHFDNDNNHSVVTRWDFGEASVLVTGDLEEPGIRELVGGRGSLLDVDIYQVGHHGSHNGTTEELLRAMTPAWAVMEIGPASRRHSWTAWAYGHPRAKMVDMLVNAVSGSREPITVPIANGMKSFTTMTIDRAIYATAWDGTVVLEAGVDGNFRRVMPDVLR